LSAIGASTRPAELISHADYSEAKISYFEAKSADIALRSIFNMEI